MKKILFIFFLLIFISIFSVYYYLNKDYSYLNKEGIKEPVFVGHVYGEHDSSHVPYNPLKKVIKKNNIDFIVFGGDITKNHKDFYIFDNYFTKINKLYIKGNHDKNIYEKTEFWKKKNFKNLSLINLSYQKISDVYNISFNNYQNTYFVSHFNWFEKVFLPLNPSNQTLGNQNNLKFDKIINFGKNNKFISGDCGKYLDKSPYVLARYKNNYFLCTGLGKSSNNFIIMPTLEPFFFNKDGDIVKHKCKEKKFSDKLLKVCSTNKKHLIKIN